MGAGELWEDSPPASELVSVPNQWAAKPSLESGALLASPTNGNTWAFPTVHGAVLSSWLYTAQRFFFFFTTSMNIHNHCYLLSQHFAAYLPSAQNHSHGWKFNLKAFKNVFSLLHIRSANKHFRQEKLILPQTHITLFPHQTSVTNQWCIWYEILTVVHVAEFGIMLLKVTHKGKCTALFKYLIIIFPD